MPELPEVEVTRLGLLPCISGHRVTKISHSSKRLRLALPRKLLAEYVLDNTIVTIVEVARAGLIKVTGQPFAKLRA